MSDWLKELQQQYETKIGEPGSGGYPKSHWLGCDRGSSDPNRRIELPAYAPADFISCNACLIREGYIRILPCDPREIGWPHRWRKCDKCDYGLDCGTWARVRGAGEQVEIALRQFDPAAYHPVTWAETGLIPFYNGGVFFPSKVALDRFMSDLATKYPAHFDESYQEPCYCIPIRREPMSASIEESSDINVDTGECLHSHCRGFKADFGYYPKSHDDHIP